MRPSGNSRTVWVKGCLVFFRKSIVLVWPPVSYQSKGGIQLLKTLYSQEMFIFFFFFYQKQFFGATFKVWYCKFSAAFSTDIQHCTNQLAFWSPLRYSWKNLYEQWNVVNIQRHKIYAPLISLIINWWFILWALTHRSTQGKWSCVFWLLHEYIQPFLIAYCIFSE